MSRSSNKSVSQWAALINEYNAGSDTEREFCARHDMKLNTFRKWRYHFKNTKKKQADSGAARSGFAKVNVRSSDPMPNHLGATLCLGNDIRVECPATFDVSSLAQLALEIQRGR